jgi:hypothetical protein
MAAEQGNAEAQNNLGVMYHEGQGVPQDYSESARWYQSAANQGFAGAQFNLGLMYSAGQGVPMDNVQAYMWYSLAGVSPDPAAAKAVLKSRKELARRMSPVQIAEAERLAREWKPETGR